MGYVNNQTDTLWADVSEFQTPVNWSYTDAGYRVICIRSNDGDHQDAHFVANYQWCVEATNQGALDSFIVYYYWRPNGTGVTTHTQMVNELGVHPRMVSMMDVESGDGNGSYDRSNQLNGEYNQLGRWLGDRQRVIGYGNVGDLNSIWPNKPQGLKLIVAGYGADPGYPGKIGHQYTDGTGFGAAAGLPDGAPPFGNCDMNCADGLSSQAFAASCGLGVPVLTPPTAPPPAPSPLPPSTYTVQYGDTLGAIANKLGVSLQQLLAANPLVTNPNLIYPGEVLHLPAAPAGGSPNGPLPLDDSIYSAASNIISQFTGAA